jgi:hypothetical protein
MLGAAVVSILEGSPAVTALAGQRIYPVRLPRGVTLPAITYLIVSAPRDETQQGPSGLVYTRLQVSCWGEDYDAAKAVSEAVRRTLDGYRGTVADLRIDGVELLSERDDIEPEPGTYQSVLDLRVKYAEPVGL